MSKKKIAVMQPYFFPYLGYWQLINAVDTFIIYDDVNFIKRGWIHRNRILSNNDSQFININLRKVSQNKKIDEIEISDDIQWRNKLIKQLEYTYKKAPFYDIVYPILISVIENNTISLSKFLTDTIIQIVDFLGIKTEIIKSSSDYNNSHLDRQTRLIDIVKKEHGSVYINALGGRELYSKQAFESEGLELYFIQSKELNYSQFKNEFVPHLSIIDVMMFNDIEEIHKMLNSFELI